MAATPIVAADTSPQGGVGQVATMVPTRTTAKAAIVAPVLMAMAPSQ